MVDASRDGTADEVERHFPRRPRAPTCRRDGSPPNSGATAWTRPTPRWSRSRRPRWSRSRAGCGPLLDRLEETGAAVVGGPIEPAELARRRATGRSICFATSTTCGPLSRSRRASSRRATTRSTAATAWTGSNRSGSRASGRSRSTGHSAPGENGWRMADDAVVEFQGGTCLPASLRQRHAHARHYGASRARADRARRSDWRGSARRPAGARRAAAPDRRRAAAAGRVARAPGCRRCRSSLALLAAWSLGEANCGDVAAGPREVEIRRAA